MIHERRRLIPTMIAVIIGVEIGRASCRERV